MSKYYSFLVRCKSCGDKRRVKGHMLGKHADMKPGDSLNWPCPCKGAGPGQVGGSVYEVVSKDIT